MRLRVARAGLGSQAELANRAGVSDRMIGLIEQARIEHRPRPTTLARLALSVGENPKDWLELAGLKMSRGEIDALRQVVKVKARMDEIEPADTIKAQLREEMEQRLNELIAALEDVKARIKDFRHPKAIKTEVEDLIREYVRQFELPEKIKRDLRDDFRRSLNQRLSDSEPAEKLRKELTAYVDSRLSEIRKVIGDLDRRLRQLAAWQMDLMRHVGLSIPQTHKNRRS